MLQTLVQLLGRGKELLLLLLEQGVVQSLLLLEGRVLLGLGLLLRAWVELRGELRSIAVQVLQLWPLELLGPLLLLLLLLGLGHGGTASEVSLARLVRDLALQARRHELRLLEAERWQLVRIRGRRLLLLRLTVLGRRNELLGRREWLLLNLQGGHPLDLRLRLLLDL